MGVLPFVAAWPIDGLIWLAELVREQTEQELESHTSAARETLDDVAASVASGYLSEEDGRRMEENILGQILNLPTAGDAARATARIESGPDGNVQDHQD